MHTFTTAHRAEAMSHTVSYKRVPIFRGLAFALYHVDKHGGRIDLHSADRRHKEISEHNRQFGTTLSTQIELERLHAEDPAHHAPANSSFTSSHCLRSDGNAAYQGRVSGESIPWFQLGLDLDDHGKVEDPSHFIAVARRLGYELEQPYRAGSELHHVVFTASPVPVLERWNVISKERA